MKAALFYGSRQPLRIEEIPTPTPGPHQILVDVAACGVCHTDLHYLDLDVKTSKPPPLILGHEPSGVVAKVGRDVKNFKEGDRVLMPAVLTCGSCFYCRTGRENICETVTMFGNNIDGGYAEFMLAPAKDCFQLPPEIPLQDACIIADAISTPFHAVKNRARVKAGDTVAVFGCGGVGINVVQCAAAAGGSVIAIDLSPQKLEFARKMGAVHTIRADEAIDIAHEIVELTHGGVDVAIEAIGSPVTVRRAYESIRKGGRLCVIGYVAHDVPIAAGRLMYQELEIVGSLGCRPVDYPHLIDMVRLGKIQVSPIVTAKVPLDRINEAFDILRSGEGMRTIVIP